MLFANLKETSGTEHSVQTTNNVITDLNWHHVALTYDKTTGNYVFYADGKNVGSGNLPALRLQTTYPLNLGYRQGYIFTGMEDEVTIYPRALSATEIQTIFSHGTGGKTYQPTSIILNAITNNTVITGTTTNFSVTPTVDAATTIASISWIIDGTQVSTGSTTNYTWTTTIGTHTIYATLTDALGKTVYTTTNTITGDHAPNIPTIAFSSSHSTNYLPTETISVTISNISDPDIGDSITNIVYYVDGISKFTNNSPSNTSTQTVLLPTLTGTHTFYTIVTDTHNASAQSATISSYTGPTPILHLDASAITGITDGQKITNWPDTSGNGFNFTTMGASTDPIYKTNGIGGKPTIYFSGSQALKQNTAICPTRPLTMFLVFKITSWGGFRGIIGTSSDDAVNGSATVGDLIYVDTVNALLDIFNNGVNYYGPRGAAGINNNIAYYYTITHAASYSPRQWVSGVSDGATPYSTTSNFGLNGYQYIGAMDKSMRNPYYGYISEIIVYNTVLSDADRQAVEATLKAKYGL